MHSNYEALLPIGKVIRGRILNITAERIQVSIQPGVYGTIRNTELTPGMKAGKPIDVQISAYGSADEIYLTPVKNQPAPAPGSREVYPRRAPSASAPEQAAPAIPAPNPGAGNTPIKPWKDWDKIPTGHNQAETALSALRDCTAAFSRELEKARKELNDAKSQSQEYRDAAAKGAQANYEQDSKRASEHCDYEIEQTRKRLQAPAGVVKACEDYANNLPVKSKDARASAQNAVDTIKSDQKEVERAIAAKVKAYQALRDYKLTTLERERNNKLNQARKEHHDRVNQAERSFETKSRSICSKREAEIAAGFNRATIQAYSQEVNRYQFNASSYVCPTEVPDHVMLGAIGYDIPKSSKEDIPVVQAVERQAEDYCKKGSDAYTVLLPYSQRLKDGLSLMIRYASTDRTAVQSRIQPLLLKLFMAFPPGKLEATMIDPLDMGASFSDIPRLSKGPGTNRIIDTRVWTTDKDIENAIATLRQRLENITSAYGDDTESRLRKEAVRVLAITDFPANFTEAALKNLHAIVRNSASLGVCVLICANEDELEKLKQRNETLVSEIAQSIVDTKYSGGKLALLGAKQEGLFLQLEDMRDVMESKNSILSQLSDAIEHAPGRTEAFNNMFPYDIYDSNHWFTGPENEVAIPLGIRGAASVVKMVVSRGRGATQHHALITGPTGAGKSTLLHTLIMSTLISYRPEDVQLYLLDFKEGVEFGLYTHYRLPSLRVVAIKSEREFGLNVLKELCTELENRASYLSRKDVSDVNDYVDKTHSPKYPKLLLVFDEVQELFRGQEDGDSITSECLSCVNKLVMQGREMGIHVIFATQDFQNCSGLNQYFSQMKIRVVIKGSEDGAAASILSSDNEGTRALMNEPAGAAIYNDEGGAAPSNNVFQVCYLEEKDRIKLLSRLDAYYRTPVVAEQYEHLQTRILLTNAQDNDFNCFNQLIKRGPDSLQSLAAHSDGYGLLLGEGFGRKAHFVCELRRSSKDNLLIVGADEKKALGMFELAAMSLLYEELHTAHDKSNALVYIADLSDDECSEDKCDFEFLKSCFQKQIKRAELGDIERLIRDLYETVVARAEGSKASDERIFFLFFGINRARRLQTGGLYDDDCGSLTPMEMLREILVRGPMQGVNSIVWGEGVSGIQYMLGDRYADLFAKRIAYGLDKDSMNALVAEEAADKLTRKSTVYMDVVCDIRNTHFRPYDVPQKEWIRKYAGVYDTIVGEER